MPKIVVREIDKTTAAGAPYANFAVVVPGFVANDKNTADAWGKVKDENDVYECTNKEDFRKYVGLTSSVNHKFVEAVAPTINKEWAEPKNLTATEFNTAVEKGNLYYVVAENTSTTVGELLDDNYKYAIASKADISKYVFTESTGESAKTIFVALDSIGQDERYVTHYGNQIAWELLGLGYTVLYKKLTSLDDLKNDTFWKPLKDKTMYDFRYLVSGLLNGNDQVYEKMLDVAEFTPEDKAFDNVDPLSDGRGDCIALFDIDQSVYLGKSQEAAINDILAFAKDNISTSKYAAVFAPTVEYAVVDDADSFGGNKTFPASFHYLACAARSSENFNEWYANAGYTRGISKYTINKVGCKFGEAAVSMFQRRFKLVEGEVEKVTMAINPIINLRGSYYLWGNRTAYGLGAKGTPDGDLKAGHFLNIRQLCSTIKKQVYITCRQATFNPNSDILWINFCNSIKPTLEKMKADQGIADYKIMKIKNNRKAFLSALIRIVPIEAVEDFDISIHLEDSLDGVVATTEE